MHSNMEYRHTQDWHTDLTVREVMAFPKVKDASCLMMQAPDEVDPKQLEELGLEIEKKEEKEEK